MGTLTKAALLAVAKPTVTSVDVEGLGKVLVREYPPVLLSERMVAIYDPAGNLIPEEQARQGVYAILDCVMADESTPMFTEDEFDTVAGMSLGVFELLSKAVETVNEASQKKVTAG